MVCFSVACNSKSEVKQDSDNGSTRRQTLILWVESSSVFALVPLAGAAS